MEKFHKLVVVLILTSSLVSSTRGAQPPQAPGGPPGMVSHTIFPLVVVSATGCVARYDISINKKPQQAEGRKWLPTFCAAIVGFGLDNLLQGSDDQKKAAIEAVAGALTAVGVDYFLLTDEKKQDENTQEIRKINLYSQFLWGGSASVGINNGLLNKTLKYLQSWM